MSIRAMVGIVALLALLAIVTILPLTPVSGQQTSIVTNVPARGRLWSARAQMVSAASSNSNVAAVQVDNRAEQGGLSAICRAAGSTNITFSFRVAGRDQPIEATTALTCGPAVSIAMRVDEPAQRLVRPYPITALKCPAFAECQIANAGSLRGPLSASVHPPNAEEGSLAFQPAPGALRVRCTSNGSGSLELDERSLPGVLPDTVEWTWEDVVMVGIRCTVPEQG